VVDREHADVARSLLRGRQELFADPAAWWSVKPRDYDELVRLDPAAQVAGQVASLSAELDEELAQLPQERVHRIDYGAFCAAPECGIELVQDAVGPLRYRNPAVEAFTRARHGDDTPGEQRLAELVQEAMAR